MAPNRKQSNSLSRLLSLEGAVTSRTNIHSDVIATRSPSFNFLFGNGWGLPAGYSMLLYGPPRGGKSVICNEMAGFVHASDPEGIVIKFNTEFREVGQLDDEMFKMYNIDPDRLVAFETNTPDQIFDRIEKEIAAEIQNGLKVKLVIIDSLTQIQGRRGMNADTIMTQQIGDKALTIQEGLSRILPVQRKHKFGLVLTSHIRAAMDVQNSGSATVRTGQMSGFRPATSWGTQHHCEYYVYVSPDTSKDGKTSLSGEEFLDKNVEDMKGHNEKTGHKVTCKMMDASIGPKGRTGQFTFDYHKGIINTHEEAFLLGVNRGIIDRPNNLTYAFGDKKWTGKPSTLEAFKNDPQLVEAVLKELRRRDLANEITEPKVVVEEESA
jgi:RecA/RadA recombinase